jgi:hypothetical protein
MFICTVLTGLTLIMAQLYSKLKVYAYLREPEEHHMPWAATHMAGVLNACKAVSLHERLPRQPIAMCTSMGMRCGLQSG